MEFQGKAVLVSGGSSGIGRATALAFAGRGARVVVAARGRERGEEIVREIETQGGESLFVPADLGVPEDVRRMVEAAVERFGRLDAAVNNAAAASGAFRATADFEEAEFDATVAVNLKGVWLALKHEIHQMLAQDPPGGAIVNTSSVNGLGAAPMGSIYSATKAGVLAFTKAAALEYAQANIRVNALVPGAFETPMLEGVWRRMGGEEAGAREQYESRIAMGRIGRAEEAAEAVVWLCSEGASYVTGHSMIVDGGLTAPFR